MSFDHAHLFFLKHKQEERIAPQLDTLLRANGIRINERSKFAWNRTLSPNMSRSRALP
jgi:hypothetical protein